MHRRLCKHVNCSCWQVIGGHSGGSSLPSRQSGEKSHFHLRGMHFCPSAHLNTSGSLQSRLTSCLCPSTALDSTSTRHKIKLMIMSWTEKTSHWMTHSTSFTSKPLRTNPGFVGLEFVERPTTFHILLSTSSASILSDNWSQHSTINHKTFFVHRNWKTCLSWNFYYCY